MNKQFRAINCPSVPFGRSGAESGAGVGADPEPAEKPVWSVRELLVWAYRDQKVHLLDEGPDGFLEKLGYAWADFGAMAELGVRVDVTPLHGHVGFRVHRDAETVHEVVSALSDEDRFMIIGAALIDALPVHLRDVPAPRVVPVRRPNGKLKMDYRNGRAVACRIDVERVSEEDLLEIGQFSKIFDMIGYGLAGKEISVCRLE